MQHSPSTPSRELKRNIGKKGYRHQHKKYRKRYGKNDYRGRIPNRVDIDDRPTVVDARSRIGDWEVDLVIGKEHQGGFATLAERKSRLYLAIPIKNKTAQATNKAILKLLEPIKNWIKTLKHLSNAFLISALFSCSFFLHSLAYTYYPFYFSKHFLKEK